MMKTNNKYPISKSRTSQLYQLLQRLEIKPEDTIFNTKNSQRYFAIINEALTHTSAQADINHERLEFLGDAVLRLVASEFISKNFPHMTVGERSALRAQIVSDKWLTKVGNQIGIEKVLIIGPKAAGDDSAKATLQAEATEALIGALYECLGDLTAIHKWLYPYWKEASAAVLNDPHQQNSKSALQEWSQSQGMKLPNYQSSEKSQQHGDPRRFFCKVHLNGKPIGQGWGRSRQDAEKEAARLALKKLRKVNNQEVKPVQDS